MVTIALTMISFVTVAAEPMQVFEKIGETLGLTTEVALSDSTLFVSDHELQRLSEKLFALDANNAARYIRLNLQTKISHTSTIDYAKKPLLMVNPAVWKIPTYAKLRLLYDNYHMDTNDEEALDNNQRMRETEFLKEIMKTPVMQYLHRYLLSRRRAKNNIRVTRDMMATLWFCYFTKNGHRRNFTSPFEHTFLSEVHNGQLKGLHNWLYFSEMERLQQIKYMGYFKFFAFTRNRGIIKLTFSMSKLYKPVTTMFIGTSPEFELAIYTTCATLRFGRPCSIQIKHSASPYETEFIETLRKLWFDRFSRNSQFYSKSSSAFEHTFLTEYHFGQFQGFHNWLFYLKLEKETNVDYMGYMQYQTLGNKAAYINLKCKMFHAYKFLTTMLIGTSPEFEIAIYTLCITARPVQACHLSLGGKNVTVLQRTEPIEGKDVAVSAYPFMINVMVFRY